MKETKQEIPLDESAAPADPHVLLVEDELIVALELEERLRRRGYTVVDTVRSAAEALAVLSHRRVDLAVIDIRLEGARDGVDLAGDMRAQGIPVVFLTAHDDEETLRRVKSVDAQAYLLKPLDERLLHLTIDTALHRHAAERARLESERALQSAQALQATILAHSPDAVLVVREGVSIELSNMAAQVMFRLGAEQLAGARLGDLFPANDYSELVAASPGSSRRLLACRHGGESFLVEVSSGLTPAEDSARLILIVRDVSAQAQLEERLLQARQLEVAGRVATGMAHDLNNLLSIVWMSAYMLRTAPVDKQQELLDALDSAVTLGRAMTTRLLALAGRSEGGAREIVVDDALRTITGLMDRCVGEDVELSMEFEPDLGTIQLEPAQLDMCVMNLILNADRAMPAGGRLTIRATTVPCARGPALVRIEVEDSGIGMSEEVRRRLFEPFFSTHSESGGTGLGLWIVKNIVEKSGGELGFESELGRGTCIWFTLSRHADARQDLRQKSSSPGPSLSGEGRWILLVDDDDGHRNSLARMLEAEGFRLVHARGAGEALLLAERAPHELSLAIIDIELPYMNGVELSERLESLRPNLPVLLISGSGRPADARAGARVVLPKPIQLPILLQEISKAVRTS